MAISVNDRMPLTLQQSQKSKDSLKLAGMQKNFSIISEVPSTDIAPNIAPKNNNEDNNSQVNEIIDTLKALQVARKSLSDVQSITKDIKSNYKTEKNDAWAPVDDTMLKQRYESLQQIKDILKNATFNHKNVFTMDYSKNGVKLDLGRKDTSMLNLRDEHSIDIFSDNISLLSQQIEENIQKLQSKVDKINNSRWLSMENLRNVKLQPKEVNATLQANATPSLASALAQIAQKQNLQQEATNPLAIEQKEIQNNQNNKEALQSQLIKTAESNLDAKLNKTNNDNKEAKSDSKTESKGDTAKNEINQDENQNTKDTKETPEMQIENTKDSNTTQQKQDSANNANKTNETKEDNANKAQQENTDTKEDNIQSPDKQDNSNAKQAENEKTESNVESAISQAHTADDNKEEKTADSKDSKVESKENSAQASVQSDTHQTAQDETHKEAKTANTTQENHAKDEAGKEQNVAQTTETTNESKNDTQNKVAQTEASTKTTDEKGSPTPAGNKGNEANAERVVDVFV